MTTHEEHLFKNKAILWQNTPETSGTKSAWQQTKMKYKDLVQTFNYEYLWGCLACFLNIEYSNLTFVMAIGKLRPIEATYC